MEFIFIFTFFIFAIVSSILFKNRKSIELVSIIASINAFFWSFVIALKVARLEVYSPYTFLSVDSLGTIIMLIVATVALAATAYSVIYLRIEMQKNIIGFSRVKQYFILLNIFCLVMFLAIASNNPIMTWIFIEATTLSTAFLISFYNKPSAMEGAWKYLIINSVGLLLGFFGILLYFTSLSSDQHAGFITWNDLLSNAQFQDADIIKIAFIFVLIGYGTKVGLAPMHTWKPDAYSKAPAPIGALFSGALLPVAFLVILKFKVITDVVVGSEFVETLFIIFGVLSIGIASLILFSAKNYKRLLAYSSIENAGVIALGFGFGGIGIFAAILHLIYHSLIKAAMFPLAGNFLLKYNSAKIRNVSGALTVMPVTSVLFLIGFLTVTGTPPFGMFLTKFSILFTGIENYPVASIMAIIFTELLFVGFFKHAIAMVFGDKPKDVNIEKGEVNYWLTIPSVILIVVTISLSFYIPQFLNKLLITASAIY